MPKTFSEKRFSRLISSMFRETKIYVNAFKKKDFFEIFFSWVPDFYKDFKELSDRSKTDYVNYTTGSAGKLIRFIPSLDGDFIPVKDNGRLVVYDGVYDRTQRDAAREAIYDFYRMHGHENVMREVINAALATINELSIPDPVSSEAENLFSVDEREKFCKAYDYFKSRIDNGIEPADILGELSWYTLSGRYNYPASDRPEPNVYIASKKIIENETEVYNLDDRCKDADHLMVVAFAATSFLGGRLISRSTYSVKWTNFFEKLSRGKASVDFVVLEPLSSAEIDAVQFKMRPLTINKEINVSDIVTKNILTLKNEIEKNDLKNVHLYTTKIALPVSYVITEFMDDHDRDSMKCDLYLPILNNYIDIGGSELRLEDEKYNDHTVRQSFVLYRNDPKTHDLYEMLLHNAYSILKSSEQVL